MRFARVAGFAAAMAIGAAAIGAAAPADAGAYRRENWFWHYYNEPWCLAASTGLDECSYYTLQQCLVSRSGTGGQCYPNPRLSYAPDPSPPPAPHRKTRHPPN